LEGERKKFDIELVKYKFSVYILLICQAFSLTRSGTGKTSLLKQLILQFKEQSKNHIYCVNVGPAELSDYRRELGSRVSPISLEQLPLTRPNSLVVIEDIIFLSSADEKRLRRCLNFDAHHKAQKIFCVAHSVYKTSLWSLLSFFQYLIFSSSPANKPLIRVCLKNYFKVEGSTVDNWLAQFEKLGRGENSKNMYFYFDTNLTKLFCTSDLINSKINSRQLSEHSKVPQLSVTSPDSEIEQEKTEFKKHNLTLRFEKFIEGHFLKPQAAAVFSILINCLDLKLVRDHDLTISFQSQNSKVPKRISLVDYVICLLESGAKRPSQEMLVLHNYLQSYCTIPSIFVNNNYLKNFPASLA